MTKGKQQLIYDSYTISFLVGFLFAFLFTAPGMAVTGVTGTGTATSADTYAENFVDPDGKNIEFDTLYHRGGTFYQGEGTDVRCFPTVYGRIGESIALWICGS